MCKNLLSFVGFMLVMTGCGSSSYERASINKPASSPETKNAQSAKEAIIKEALVPSDAPISANVTRRQQRFESDDAQTSQESAFHASARSLVISRIKPNKLDISGREFRVKRSPVGKGCFVYDPRTRFHGVERLIVWWVPKEGKAYALNSPSKMVTPDLKWPREEAVDAPETQEIVEYVFHDRPMSKPTLRVSKPLIPSFTVREYKIYRFVMDASISEEQALQNAAEQYGVSVSKARKAIDKVQEILMRNGWFATPDSEIRHATDWK